MKTCNKIQCNNPVFSMGFCRIHQWMRTDEGYKKMSLFKRKPPKAKPIPKESKTRKKEHIYYSVGCKELEKEIREQNNGKIFDFFTGLEIKGKVTWHHLLGRTGDDYLDKDLLVPAENNENDGHLFWHRATLEQLKAKLWYQGFLTRLKEKSLQAYEKEMRRYDKVQKLNPNLFGDDEDIDYI
jgi:hypothetical protein